MTKQVLSILIAIVSLNARANPSFSVSCSPVAGNPTLDNGKMQLSGVRTVTDTEVLQSPTGIAADDKIQPVQYLEVLSTPTNGQEIVRVTRYRLTGLGLIKGEFELWGTEDVVTSGVAPVAALKFSAFTARPRAYKVEKFAARLELTPQTDTVRPVPAVSYGFTCEARLD